MVPGNKILIGRIDKVDFPELGIQAIDAKMDTGAFSSSIHCFEIKAFLKEDKLYVKFSLFDDSNHIEHEFKVDSIRQVKNSFGQIENRYIIKTKISLFGKKITTDVALSNRSTMKFPVLIGRKLLANRFIVDVSQQYVSFKKKKLSSRKKSK